MRPSTGLLLAMTLALAALPVFGSPEAERVTLLLTSCEGSSAQFVHRFLPKGYKKETIERGMVIFGSLPSMRWTYSNPEAKEFVFDGTTSWLWVPADRQVTVHELSGDERASLPFFALSEPSRIDARFSVARSGRRTTLKARDKSAPLAEIVVEEAAEGRLASLRYVDSQGNATTFEFSSFESSNAGPETFRFVAPPDTDVIRN